MTATMPASGPTTDTSTRQTAPTSDASFSSDGSAVDRNLGWRQNLVFGIQHVLMMYVGCVSVPLTIGAALGLDQATVAMLVNADLLVAGVITLIQSLGAGRFAGARMPVVGGAAFAQVATMISIGNTYGLPAIWGCMLAGGVIGLALAWPFSKLLKYFPPLVTGAVLLVLGISLIGVPGGLILGDEGTDSYARPLYIVSPPSWSSSPSGSAPWPVAWSPRRPCSSPRSPASCCADPPACWTSRVSATSRCSPWSPRSTSAARNSRSSA